MAIYHLSAKIVSRQSGRSVVAAAAYRSGESLDEEGTGITHDYTRKEGVEHSEILAPEGAPAWVQQRSELWNAIEHIEKRKDAQLAREVEVGLPIELDAAAQVALLRDYVKRAFVDRGMVADFSIHRDDPNNPHAHILLTMRRISPEGFGLKERSWNERARLMDWRRDWEEVTNEHLARAGLAIRIDHRSLKAQGLTLEPGRKIGVGLARQRSPELPARIADRVAEQREIAHENGERIIGQPALALRSLTHLQATFSQHDLAKFLHTRTDGAEQFQKALLKIKASPEIVFLGRDDRQLERYTSREMLELESSLLERAGRMQARDQHAVKASRQTSVLSQHRLTAEQHAAFEHLVNPGDLKVLVGVAGSGKSRLLGAANGAWEAEGYVVRGAALAGIAAENLAIASGIPSRTLASYEYAWQQQRDTLTARDVLVIDEAGMVGTRQLARVLEAAETAGAKVVLVGDPEQLQAIEAGAPFRGIVGQAGVAELQEVQRQRTPWQREATRELAIGETAEALARYERQGAVIPVETHEAARTALLARWARDAEKAPEASRLMLANTRKEVQALNECARTLRLQRSELGRAERVPTERGVKDMAVHERIYFLRNEKSLGVKNGSLGTIESVRGGVLQVMLDGHERRRIAVDTRFYKDLDYGYAATVHKAQGTTVDRSYVLATAHFDRHATYVALSRHREATTLFYAAEDFGVVAEEITDRKLARARLLVALGRPRPKELVHDYLDRAAPSERPSASSGRTDLMDDIEGQQQQAAERWRARQRAHEQGPQADLGQSPQGPGETPERVRDRPRRRERSHGPEDDVGP